MQSGTPPALRSTRLLDQLRESIRYRHYSLSTEKSYAHWVRAYIRFHGLRHPREMGGREVEAFLSHLANQRGASASTHKQALSALLFLYRAGAGRRAAMDAGDRPAADAGAPADGAEPR